MFVNRRDRISFLKLIKRKPVESVNLAGGNTTLELWYEIDS